MFKVADCLCFAADERRTSWLDGYALAWNFSKQMNFSQSLLSFGEHTHKNSPVLLSFATKGGDEKWICLRHLSMWNSLASNVFSSVWNSRVEVKLSPASKIDLPLLRNDWNVFYRLDCARNSAQIKFLKPIEKDSGLALINHERWACDWNLPVFSRSKNLYIIKFELSFSTCVASPLSLPHPGDGWRDLFNYCSRSSALLGKICSSFFVVCAVFVSPQWQLYKNHLPNQLVTRSCF